MHGYGDRLPAGVIIGEAVRIEAKMSGGEFRNVSEVSVYNQFLLTIRIQIIMNYSDFIYDFNLYLCERFGYRNCCSVMHNANGICVSVHVGEMDLYIRFWKYSCGVGSIPDWSIIIVRSNFKRNQQENLKDLAPFFKEYASHYGYNTSAPRMMTTSII